MNFIPRYFREPDPKGIWAVIRRLFADAGRRHLGAYGVAFGFMVFIAATTALSAWIVKDVVNKVFVDKNFQEMVFLAGAVVVISALRGVSLYGASVTLNRIGNAVVAEMQKRLYHHLLALGVDYFDKMHSSQLVMRMTMNANSVSQTLNTVLTSYGRDLLTVVGLVIVMFIQSPIMTALALTLGPLAIFGVMRIVARLRKVTQDEFAGAAHIISAMQETAAGYRILKAFNLDSAMEVRIGDSIDMLRERRNKIGRLKARTSPLMETLGGFAVAGVMLWAGYQSVFFNEPPGAFMSFLTAVLFAYEPAKRLANTRVQLERGVIGARMIYQVLDTPPNMETNPDGPELRVEGGEVVFNQVEFAYRKKKNVINKMNFRAAPGQVTALVGPSGGGKSTMIALIERFYDIAAGEILIDGQNVAAVRLASLRDQIALVSQDTVLFRESVRENIRFGRPSATDAEVEAAAKAAMAHDFIMKLDGGYDAVLEDGENALSGGQRQRLAIARAMIRDAKIILLDEATSALDSESEHQVQLAFDHLMAGRTTIVIAHRLSTVLGADRICVVARGRIIESGRHAELLAAGKHYARLYHLQFDRHSAADAAGGFEEPKVAQAG